MNSGKKNRIAWLGWSLAGMGLLTIVVNLGLVVWTLHNAQAPPPRIAGHSQQLGDVVTAGEGARISQFVNDCTAWSGKWNDVQDDISQQRTMNNVRDQISKLIGAVDELQGQHRLDNAMHYRQWLAATGTDANLLAKQILTGEARVQSEDFVNISNRLRNLAILVESLNGQEQLNALLGLKDNQIRPALERLSDSMKALTLDPAIHDALTPQAIHDLGAAIFGEGYSIDDRRQTIHVGAGGLYNLRASELQLRQQRDDLFRQASDVFEALQQNPITITQTSSPAFQTPAEEFKFDLIRNWRPISICAGAGLAIFAILAFAIVRGIGKQIDENEKAAVELERANQQHQQIGPQAQQADSSAAILRAVADLVGGVTTSTTVIRDGVAHSRVSNFAKAAAMIEAHRSDIGEFLTVHEKGKQLPAYFTILARQLSQEHEALLKELNSLVQGVEQIKHAVDQQQPANQPSPEANAQTTGKSEPETGA